MKICSWSRVSFSKDRFNTMRGGTALEYYDNESKFLWWEAPPRHLISRSTPLLAEPWKVGAEMCWVSWNTLKIVFAVQCRLSSGLTRPLSIVEFWLPWLLLWRRRHRSQQKYISIRRLWFKNELRWSINDDPSYPTRRQHLYCLCWWTAEWLTPLWRFILSWAAIMFASTDILGYSSYSSFWQSRGSRGSRIAS